MKKYLCSTVRTLSGVSCFQFLNSSFSNFFLKFLTIRCLFSIETTFEIVLLIVILVGGWKQNEK